MQMLARLVLLLSFTAFLYACNDPNKDCGVADVVKKLDERQVNGKTYFLVLRVSGFQDKVEFLQLYDQMPEQEAGCTWGKRDPLDSLSLEENQRVKKVILKNGKLEIISPTGKEPGSALEELKLTVAE